MILFGVDFGRVFLGWVTLSNAVREAANFAAINPNAWGTPGNAAARTEYERLITVESAGINCALPATIPAPTFPSGTDIGSPALVAITCEFTLITPLIGNILGNPLDVSSSASFPIRSGSIAGVPVSSGGTLPTFSAGPSAAPSASVDPSASVVPTPSAGITAPPMCLVPDLVQGNTKTDAATALWTARGFTANNLIFSPLVPPHFDMKDQSLTAGASVLCTSSMTVYDKKQ